MKAIHSPWAASSILAIAVMALSAPAVAQQAQDDSAGNSGNGGGIADIVVTAQFQSQRLQDTPLAITAVDAAALEARSATRVTDISDSAPSVLIKPSNASFGPAATVFIRGIGQGDSSFAMEPGVGIYIDDVYYGSLFGANFDLLDLDRVEILRGPQGTLSGKNSIGGSMKLFSRKPDGKGSNFIEASYGSRNLLSIRGGADITLVPDQLYARLSGVYTSQDGYSTRYDYGCLNPSSGVPAAGISQNCVLGHEGGKNYGGGRLALSYTPTTSLSIDLSATLIKDTSEVAPTQLIGATARADAFFAPYSPSMFVVPEGSRYSYATYMTPSFTDPSIYDGAEGAGTHPAVSVPTHNDLLQSSFNATIGWEIADGLQLKSITGYSHMRVAYGIDGDASPITTQTALYQARSNQFSQELRLNGKAFADLLDWTIGGYYYQAKNNFSGSNILYPGKVFENLNAPDDDVTSKNKSVFGQLIVHPADRLNITGGLRYTKDSKDYIYRRYNPFLPGVPTFTPAGILTGKESHYSANKLDYRINVDYRWSSALMTYAQVATGFRGGGVNPRPFVPEQAVPFDPETITSYEIGFKSDLFDRRVRFNMSAFMNDYKDIIFTNLAPTANSAQNATPTNVGTARYKGVEAELLARPVDGLMLDANLSWLDFQLKSFTAQGVIISGVTLDNKAPFAPKWKVALGAQYEVETAIGSFTPRLDYTYQSSYFTGIDNAPEGKVDGYGIFNARLTFDTPDKDWRLSLAAKNLFNKFYYNNKFFNLGMILGSAAPPREVSLTLRRTF